jgi:predicted nucleic acid-binding protein
MAADPFLDTNVLVYAFGTGDPRCGRAEEVLAAGGVIGVQVLNEFTNVMHRKLRWEWPRIERAIDVLGELLEPVRPLTAPIHAQGLQLARQYRLAFDDALVIAAAAEAGCSQLLSEDLQHGRRYGTVTVRNPFRA